MPRVLTDEDLGDPQLVRVAIDCMARALEDHAAGKMIAPPRHSVGFGELGQITFTVGGSSGEAGAAGFRAYESFGSDDATRTQLIAVWNPNTGAMDGVVLGERVGKLRTGALGAVAIDRMARPDSHIVAVLGTGPQARVQLECAAQVRDVKEVRVFSRSAGNRKNFAASASEAFGLNVRPAETAREAVEGADIVISATTSPTPVIDTAWLGVGVHISMIGSKTLARHEMPRSAGQLAVVIATDAPEQIAAMDPPFFLAGTPHAERMVSLSGIVTGARSGRTAPEDTTLFCSGGLAGTEVLLAAQLLRDKT